VSRAEDGADASAATGGVGRMAAPDIRLVLGEIAVAVRDALGADRVSCYPIDVDAKTVADVVTTEDDPARRALLAGSVGRGADRLPIWGMLLRSPDPMVAVEDLAADPRVPQGLAARLGAGALLAARLEHASVSDGVAPLQLGTLFCSFAAARRFRDHDRARVRALARLASLALATAHMHASARARLEADRVLAAEQAALRRVATEVAADVEPERVFASVAREAARLLDVEAAVVCRFGESGATVVGSVGGHSRVGELLPTGGGGALAVVARTGRGHEIADYSALEPGRLRAHAMAHGYRASVAAPVSTAGRLWGAVLATTRRDEGMPPRAAERLAGFAELIGLAIGNAEARARLEARAASDPLTELANHRTFFERLHADGERAHRHARPLSLVLIDIDHFKAVNDAHGHLTGDAVLVEVARRLRAAARAGDTLARIGGEEFAWILPESRRDDAGAVAERARRAVAAAPFPAVGRLTISAGVAELGRGMAPTDLVQAADAALYAAKRAGRDLCLTWPLEPGPLAGAA
jgi:diguanylate cyclase (GGDEF)-like protein